ncbi:MAG TPA: 5-deoxy-glucuronate isomerase [Ktedonobacteraceae bacterium]|jgi:5-deoxy-glucuronate isomerase|nr:5-deoxy-glucuronate isomerase [Ktedonobacteraceae bacterium]
MGVLVKPQADQAGGILRAVDITQETAGWHSISFSVYGHLLARVVHRPDMSIEVRSAGNTHRGIQHILDADQEAERFIIVEVITSTGNWSSFPSHKHNTDNPPHESYLEKTYYHPVQSTNGFAFQRVYDYARFVETVAVHEAD